MRRENDRRIGCKGKTHFRWKIKWRLEHLGALGIMGERAPLKDRFSPALQLDRAFGVRSLRALSTCGRPVVGLRSASDGPCTLVTIYTTAGMILALAAPIKIC